VNFISPVSGPVIDQVNLAPGDFAVPARLQLQQFGLGGADFVTIEGLQQNKRAGRDFHQ